jgi:hypothetical protein
MVSNNTKQAMKPTKTKCSLVPGGVDATAALTINSLKDSAAKNAKEVKITLFNTNSTETVVATLSTKSGMFFLSFFSNYVV